MTCLCRESCSKSACSTGQCFQEHWLFESLTDGQMGKLKEIGLRKTFAAGTPVFTQGAAAGEMFLIKSGRIKLSKVSEHGDEITLDFRKAGDIIGEQVFSGEADYPVSAVALEETVTCGIDLKSFNRLVMSNPDIGLGVIRSMSIRMGAMTERLESMSGTSLEARLHSVLSHIAVEHGTDDGSGVALNFSLTHEELGFLVGAHRVSVTKAMKRLAESGKVQRHGKLLTILS